MKQLLEKLLNIPDMILMPALLICMLLFSAVLWADDGRYYFVEFDYIQSDTQPQGQVDTRFDQALIDAGRSPSEHLFGNEPARRYGAMLGTGYRDGNSLFEYGVFVDPNAKVVGHSDLGVIHVDTDSAGVFFLGGYQWKRLIGKIGAHITYTEADVHSWIPRTPEILDEYHDTYRDWSSGIVVSLGVELTSHISGNCTLFKDVGDMDKIGTDSLLFCGGRYQF